VRTGIVIIGRNEGQRLVRCFESLREQQSPAVYVDSGSTDASVQEAGSRGMEVVVLDMSIPFTAARARNAGFRRLLQLDPDLDAVQFFDGDCEVAPGWVAAAAAFLATRPEVGVVFGIQKERNPHRSIYNTLIDIEWDTPRGCALSSTGNMMCRRELFARLGGFREALIAGEDPEFCLRVRQSGALVWHLDVPMVLHDAEMSRFGQWWRRAKRGGYAFAEGAALHGSTAERHFVRETRSIFIWGLLIPFLLLGSVLLITPWAAFLVLVYPLQIARIAPRGNRSIRDNLLHAAFVVLAKFPEAAGGIKYYLDRALRGPQRLIEYK
jgi:glycosyltransferase involved in cell wall biosynthesis